MATVFHAKSLVEVLCWEEGEELWIPARVLDVWKYEDQVRDCCYSELKA